MKSISFLRNPPCLSGSVVLSLCFSVVTTVNIAGCAATSPPQDNELPTISADDQHLATITLDRALEALPSGKTLTWTSSTSGMSGTILLTKTWLSTDGTTYCREYQESLHLKGEIQNRHSIACRRNGVWVPEH